MRSHTISLSQGTPQVTATLHACLSRICPRLRTKYRWIDRICINQEDLEEKGEQVPLMRVIYNNASDVAIWLGDDDVLASRLAPLAMDNQTFVFGPLWPKSIAKA